MQSTHLARRLANARNELRSANLDALIVTHPPNVRYLTGLSATAGAVVVTLSACVLVVDFRYVTAARAVIAERGDDAVDLGVVERSHDDTLAAWLRRLGARRIGIEGDSLSVTRFRRLSGLLASSAEPDRQETLVPTERLIERGRMIKDAGEIATLRDAARRLSAVAREIPGMVRAGRSEQEVAGDIDAALRRAGFERPAFDTIVASGPNSALPHARPGLRVLQPGDGVVLDFGGVYDGYCVDLTRTLHLGMPGPVFRHLFDAVAEAHAAAIAAVRPGVLASQIDAAARDALGRRGLAEAFGHGTGHGLGLEIHEEPRISKALGVHPDETIAAGMVFTIEPGAYVEGLGGVRIEDDVLVVEGGCQVLTEVPIELPAASDQLPADNDW